MTDTYSLVHFTSLFFLNKIPAGNGHAIDAVVQVQTIPFEHTKKTAH